ncbi:MAG: protoheme IX farnesyltransferase [Planctomycetaceae bacterium]|jgi:heme o synthase|nr:protoheme IX farnesyltransferase [Planctomycetaceae bacterium]
MSASVLTYDESTETSRARFSDYVELTKPRISLMVMVSVAITAIVARHGQPDFLAIVHALVGTLLTAGSASAMNQWMERDLDKVMPRTKNRPLPAGRISSFQVMVLVITSLVMGAGYLAVMVNPLTAGLSILTWVIYIAFYTPMKTKTPLNTAVGAISGALPILMGWAAVEGSWTDARWAALFLVMFFWQFPHFMAIAYLYRKQYSEAGMKMWTVVDPSQRRSGIEAVIGALAVLPVSLATIGSIPDSGVQLVIVFGLGVFQLVCAIRYCMNANDTTARKLLRASLIYLPLVLFTLLSMPMAG